MMDLNHQQSRLDLQDMMKLSDHNLCNKVLYLMDLFLFQIVLQQVFLKL